MNISLITTPGIVMPMPVYIFSMGSEFPSSSTPVLKLTYMGLAVS